MESSADPWKRVIGGRPTNIKEYPFYVRPAIKRFFIRSEIFIHVVATCKTY